jgi:predicted O-methyltransferase YrrM
MHTPQEYREMEFIELFIALAKLYKPKVYVELGVKKGYTLKRIAPFVKQAIGIDIAPLAIDLPNVKFIQSKTTEFAQSLAGREPFIDMLFIDADHSARAVVEDFAAYFPYVRPGTGLILLHDTHPIMEALTADGYCSDAWKAASYIRRVVVDCEIVTLPGPWAGLSICRKLGAHHLSWRT